MISNPHSVAADMATCDVWAGAFSCKSRTTGSIKSAERDRRYLEISSRV